MTDLLKEFKFFRSQPHNMKVLLLTNLCFAFVLPVIEIFVGAYIMRNTGRPASVAVYQLAQYTGIVCASLINGFLLKKFNVRSLYMFGIVVSGISLLVMMSLPSLSLAGLLASGLLLGISVGFFWTNRYLLALNSTNDDNRNYFYGLESFFFAVCSIVVPLLVGWFLAYAFREAGDPVGNINRAYRTVTFIALGICIVACIILSRARFVNPVHKRFLFFRYEPLWYKMIGLAMFKGLVQGFLVTAPAILILRLVGNEGTLGLVQGIGGIITAVIIYILGRVAKPSDRIIIFSVGIFIFFAGTLCNAILFSAAGVIAFVLGRIFFQPLHDLAYNPIELRTIDVVSHRENRNQYAYIMNHEIGLYIGRALGLGLFIVLAAAVSEDFALKYALVTVALLQIVSIPLARNIVSNTDKAPKYYEKQ